MLDGTWETYKSLQLLKHGFEDPVPDQAIAEQKETEPEELTTIGNFCDIISVSLCMLQNYP